MIELSVPLRINIPIANSGGTVSKTIDIIEKSFLFFCDVFLASFMPKNSVAPHPTKITKPIATKNNIVPTESGSGGFSGKIPPLSAIITKIKKTKLPMIKAIMLYII